MHQIHTTPLVSANILEPGTGMDDWFDAERQAKPMIRQCRSGSWNTELWQLQQAMDVDVERSGWYFGMDLMPDAILQTGDGLLRQGLHDRKNK